MFRRWSVLRPFYENKEVEKQKNGNDDAENNPHQVGGEYHVMGKEFL